MKRCHENLFSTIPSDAFGYIHQYLSPESKKALSQVDKLRLKECSQLATAICFLPPNVFEKADRDNQLEECTEPYQRGIFFSNKNPAPKFLSSYEW